jgi:hypothetical protein
MSTSSLSAGDIALLRREIVARGGDIARLTDASLARVLRTTAGDVDLAATAVVMEPRPTWVTALLPY